MKDEQKAYLHSPLFVVHCSFFILHFPKKTETRSPQESGSPLALSGPCQPTPDPMAGRFVAAKPINGWDR